MAGTELLAAGQGVLLLLLLQRSASSVKKKGQGQRQRNESADFLLAFYLSALLFASALFPLFDSAMKGFLVLASAVVLAGGLVGGVIALLVPQVVSGVVLGVLLGLFVSSVMYGFSAEDSMATPHASVSAFVLTMCCGITWSHCHPESCQLLKWSIGTALLLAMVVDSFDRLDLTASLVHILQAGSMSTYSDLTDISDVTNDVPTLNALCSAANSAMFACRPHLFGYLIAWAVFSIVFCSSRNYFWGDGITISSCCVGLVTFFSRTLKRSESAGTNSSHAYMSLDTVEDNVNAASLSSPSKSAPQRTFSYPDSLEFNYFDPDELPIAVQAYADCIFVSVQSLSAEIGFQVDNSRNQAEHLLMMLTNETQKGDHLNPALPPQRLHRKLFRNYVKWCDSLGVDYHFTPLEHASGRSYAARIEDMLVYLLVWGEAANLKHMPECLCYLYHKTMADHLSLAMKKHFASNNVVFYPGYFLDMVVTPIYEVVSKSMKSGRDHCDRKNYDDFNEFFWTSNCLQYAHHHAYVGMSSSEAGVVSADDDMMTVSDAMELATKTYIEKRSWLHPLKSFSRLFEWHVITFTILATIAFHFALVWPVAYSLAIGSFVFFEINILRLLWICLDIWAIYPSSSLTGPNICGYVLRLLTGYVILVYQAIYFHWSFRIDDSDGGGDSNFWWWQYLWVSFFSLIFSFFGFFLNAVPILESYILSCNNDVVQAVLNICYPFSELYVGKKVHTTLGDSVGYFIFWFTLLAFKVWFGYNFIVKPLAGPSIELYDDYLNYPSISFSRTVILFVIWWFPHFMVYLIDLSIWFACWSSAVGATTALFDRQGAVRTSYNLRTHFMKLPFAVDQKLLPAPDAERSGVVRSASQVSTAGLPLMAKGKASEMTPLQSGGLSHRAKSSSHLHEISEEFPLVLPPPVVRSSTSSAIVEEFLDVRSQRWVNFSDVWNEVVTALREGDLLSNFEMETLLFQHFDFLLKPVYLPLYQTAGRVETALHDYKNAATNFHQERAPHKKMLIADQLKRSFDVPTWEAVEELWELVSWMMEILMGPVHKSDLTYILGKISVWAAADDLYGFMDMKNLPAILNQVCSIATVLKGSIKKRAKAPIVSVDMLNSYANESPKSSLTHSPGKSKDNVSGGSIKKSISTGFLSAYVNMTPQGNTPANEMHAKDDKASVNVNAVRTYKKLQPFRSVDILRDQTRDKIREDVRGILSNLKSSLRKGGTGDNSHVSGDVQEVLDRITFILSMEHGFLWSDIYASSQIDELAKDSRLMSVTSKIYGLCKIRQTQIEPVSPEARRRLHFFVNSLFMTMPAVPSMIFSKEYTCMTPFYAEDVILTRNDLESKNSDGVTTLLYLQTLYKNDWHHFLERIGCTDDQKIWSAKHLQETRMWASMRAQTLFRTVEGMMFTERAIRLLSKIEGLSSNAIDVMAKLKFSYVVACQAYGNMKKSGDHKADDIEFLLERYPNLRVAFIETMRTSHRDDSLSYYSVLIKHNAEKSTPADSDLLCGSREETVTTKKASLKHQARSVTEVFRIKLPGNPILGEGKPENQNHAIIFTRGRYLQAIDMNQAGYFEESLKMRNLLQEFDVTGCKILGFREHIFTGSVSSVANYMALQELSFVTLGQRVLSSPLHIRQHYGHPDLFDKLFVMTEGGMSKASKGINLSEDVFAGFNATIRGHEVGFREYVHVGKGRDVGLQQTYKFEAKLSQGNAEQSLSRDMSRICERLDFFRLMSFYFGGIGHYLTNTIVMFTLFVVVYIMIGTAVFNEEGINERPINPQGAFQLMLAGMGLLQTLPLCATLTVEKGLLQMLQEISYMILSGGPLYFIFHIQTKSFYFQQTILAGGAMYRPTGRGFVTRHSSFDENWRFFASSHIYFGAEIMTCLIIYGLYTKSEQYWGLTWSLWLAVVSFILGPFWFNPLSFESPKVLEDYNAWLLWMHEPGGSSEQSWRTWWREEYAFYKNLHISSRLVMMVFKCSMWLIIAVGLGGRQFLESTSEQERVVEIVFIFCAYLICRYLLHHLEKSCGYATRRLLYYGASLLTLGVLGYLFMNHAHYFRYLVSLYYVASALAFFMLLAGYNEAVMHVFKVHDIVLGHLIFAILLLMSVLQVGYLQTWLLYHNALSSGVAIEDVLKYARRTKERANIDDDNTVDKLRSELAKQQQLIKQLMDEKSGLRHDKHDTSSSYATYGKPTPSAAALLPSLTTDMHPNSRLQQRPLLADKGVQKPKKSYGSTSTDASSSQLKSEKREGSILSKPTVLKVDETKSTDQGNSKKVANIDTANNTNKVANVSAAASSPVLTKSSLSPARLLKKRSEPNVKTASDFIFSQPTELPPR